MKNDNINNENSVFDTYPKMGISITQLLIAILLLQYLPLNICFSWRLVFCNSIRSYLAHGL